MPAGEVFDLAVLRRLQGEAADLAAQLSAAGEAAAGEFTGRDPDRVVEVVIGAGGDPVSMQVSPAWRRALSGKDLGAAVVAAVNSAAEARLTAWAASITNQPSAAAGPSRPAHVGGSADIGDPSSRQSQLALRELFDVIGEATARLPELTRATEVAATSPVISTNAMRTVRVTATGGTVTAVDIDDQWLRTAQPDRISTGLRDALTVSAGAAAEARDKALDGGPELDRLRRLTASPETLLREIGLVR